MESVLKEHPGVEEVAVVGVSDEQWGEAGMAFIIRKRGHVVKEEEILTHAEGRLARYKWPKQVVFCKEFPRTSLGKVKKMSLVEKEGKRET